MHAIFQLCTRITLQKQKSSQNLFIPTAMFKFKPTKIRVQKLVTMSIYDPVSILFHPTVSLLYELTQLHSLQEASFKQYLSGATRGEFYKLCAEKLDSGAAVNVNNIK